MPMLHGEPAGVTGIGMVQNFVPALLCMFILLSDPYLYSFCICLCMLEYETLCNYCCTYVSMLYHVHTIFSILNLNKLGLESTCNFILFSYSFPPGYFHCPFFLY